MLLAITLRFDTADMIVPADTHERIATADTADPMASTDANDPMEPIDRADPTLPMDSTEFFDAIDSTDPLDHSDRTERSAIGTPIFTTMVLREWHRCSGNSRSGRGRAGPACQNSARSAPWSSSVAFLPRGMRERW